MNNTDVIREIQELKNKLSYSKNIGVFFGAGTSCALGIPGIFELTQSIEKTLPDFALKIFTAIKKDLGKQIKTRSIHIEDILNQLRLIREITYESENSKFQDISGKDAATVDGMICKAIYEAITEKELLADLNFTQKFFAWYNLVNRDFTKELFTTNYDLILEKSLENSEIPYLDGFVGSIEPFFCQESIDYHVLNEDLTKNWIRLWKIHGSLSWSWKGTGTTKSNRIIRNGKITNIEEINNELVIYPSREKYNASRKQPFVAYFDRMRDYLLGGELLFIITGYSFSDQHINEIFSGCMRQNNHLFVIAFSFLDCEVENISKLFSSCLNINVFGPKKAFLNGELVEWSIDKAVLDSTNNLDKFWDKDASTLTLGDFKSLVKFLLSSSGHNDNNDQVIP